MFDAIVCMCVKTRMSLVLTKGVIIDSLLVDWKLTLFVFFSSRFIFLEYADLSIQRDFFLLGSLALRICLIKSVEYA